MRRQLLSWVVLGALAGTLPLFGSKAEKKEELSPLDQYVAEAMAAAEARQGAAGGSIWSPSAPLLTLAQDLRAAHVDDIVTILVVERASAVARGATKTKRAASARASVGAIAGPTRAGGALADLARLSGEQQLEGDGATSRETLLSTRLSARVTHVLPNGNLVVEGSKAIQVNSEQQIVTIRGVVRPVDLASDNAVISDRLAQLEVKINGRGVVGDAIRRPNFLYRLLLGLLPF